MIWVRKGVVHLLSLVLFACLVGGVGAINFSLHLGNPHKLEQWLADSKIYDHVVGSALDQAQKSSNSDGSPGSVTLNDRAVQQAADTAFSPELLRTSANTFLDGNYAWLTGKTATPEFNINLVPAKQKFAELVAQAAETHLNSVPVCTSQQLAQLPIPADPLTISCRPATLDPKAERTRVTQEVNGNNDFLGNPTITASSLNQGRPYYQKLSYAPKIYQLGLKLPWILGSLAFLSILGIVYIAPGRRQGVRRVGVVLLEAGVVLIALKFAADALVSRLETKLSHGNTLISQLKQPVSDLLNRLETQLTRNDLWFGIAFVVIALIIFGFLFKTRQSSGKPKASGNSPESRDTALETTRADSDSRPLASRYSSGEVTKLEPISGKPGSPSPPTPLGKNPPKPKRPNLIQ